MEIEIIDLAEVSLLFKLIAIPALCLTLWFFYRFSMFVIETFEGVVKKLKKRKEDKSHEPEDEDIGRTE